MTQTSVLGWDIESEPGPGGWLFVRLRQPDGGAYGEFPLAETVWEMLQQRFSNKLVLEMDAVSALNSALIGQLVRLYKRIGASQGLMRLVNLSPTSQQTLQISRLGAMFPSYPNRHDAVMNGYRPAQPR